MILKGFIAILLGWTIGFVSSATFVWTSNLNGTYDWNDPSNWENGLIPDQNATVIIGPPSAGHAFSINQLNTSIILERLDLIGDVNLTILFPHRIGELNLNGSNFRSSLRTLGLGQNGNYSTIIATNAIVEVYTESNITKIKAVASFFRLFCNQIDNVELEGSSLQFLTYPSITVGTMNIVNGNISTSHDRMDIFIGNFTADCSGACRIEVL